LKATWNLFASGNSITILTNRVKSEGPKVYKHRMLDNTFLHFFSTQDSEHWDHGLLLTGMNLFDGKPEYDSVIGKL